jgi:hypothetical protein
MGFNRAALLAGYIPKKRPMARTNPNPKNTTHKVIAAGRGVVAATNLAIPTAKDIAIFRSHGLADADFPCALGDGNQKDVHDTDTADQK